MRFFYIGLTVIFSCLIGTSLAQDPVTTPKKVSGKIIDFEGPNLKVEKGAPVNLKFKGYLTPPIVKPFGVNVRVGYDKESAKNGFVYEEDLFFAPSAEGLFNVEVRFNPVMKLSRVFVITEFFDQEEVLFTQWWDSQALPDPVVAELETGGSSEKMSSESSSSEPIKVEETESPLAPKEEIIRINKKDTNPSVVTYMKEKLSPQNMGLMLSGILIALFFLWLIFHRRQNRHLCISVLGMILFISSAEAARDYEYLLPVHSQVVYSASPNSENHDLVIRMIGLDDENLTDGTLLEDKEITRVQVQMHKNDYADKVYTIEYDNLDSDPANDILINVEPDNKTFSFSIPLDQVNALVDPADFTTGVPDFGDGYWNLRVILDLVYDDPLLGTIEGEVIDFANGGGQKYVIGVDSIGPNLSLKYFNEDKAGTGTYTELADTSAILPADFTRHPIKITLTCADTANNLGPDTDFVPTLTFTPGGCPRTHPDLSFTIDPVDRDHVVKGNFCADADKEYCDDTAPRTFRVCDQAMNCSEIAFETYWYDPIPPKMNDLKTLTDPDSTTTIPDNSSQVGTPVGTIKRGILFVREHVTNILNNFSLHGRYATGSEQMAADGVNYLMTTINDLDFQLEADGSETDPELLPCFGLCPSDRTGLVPSTVDRFDLHGCGMEGLTLNPNVYVNTDWGVCDDAIRKCVNTQGFVGLYDASVPRVCIPKCPSPSPTGTTLSGSLCNTN